MNGKFAMRKNYVIGQLRGKNAFSMKTLLPIGSQESVFSGVFVSFLLPAGLSASRNHNGSLFVSVATAICQTTEAERNREGKKKTSSPYKTPSPVGSHN